jgi:hypothetical protein
MFNLFTLCLVCTHMYLHLEAIENTFRITRCSLSNAFPMQSKTINKQQEVSLHIIHIHDLRVPSFYLQDSLFKNYFRHC